MTGRSSDLERSKQSLASLPQIGLYVEEMPTRPLEGGVVSYANQPLLEVLLKVLC